MYTFSLLLLIKLDIFKCFYQSLGLIEVMVEVVPKFLLNVICLLQTPLSVVSQQLSEIAVVYTEAGSQPLCSAGVIRLQFELRFDFNSFDFFAITVK